MIHEWGRINLADRRGKELSKVKDVHRQNGVATRNNRPKAGWLLQYYFPLEAGGDLSKVD